MNKSKPECKKQIIRNTEDAKPKTIVIPLPEETIENSETAEATVQSTKAENIPKVAEINEPKLNTSLCLKKKIKEIEEIKPRKVKSLSDVPKQDRVTVDEKITKKLNFPHHQRLYKDLISLQIIEKPPPPPCASISYEPAIKDRVPKLEDFYLPLEEEEYSIPVNTTINSQPVIRDYNGLRLQRYKILV